MLRFASDMSWVQVGEDESSKVSWMRKMTIIMMMRMIHLYKDYHHHHHQVSFKANRTSEGTVPMGSEWSKNPMLDMVEGRHLIISSNHHDRHDHEPQSS